MDNHNLLSVFNEMQSNNIFINLDADYLQTLVNKPKYDKKNYIGYIQGINNTPSDIMENLYEDGSCVLVYNFISSSKTFSKNTLQILLHAMFNNFGFDPHIIFDENKIRIELVVTLEVFTSTFKESYDNYVKEIENTNNLELDTPNEDEAEEEIELDTLNEEEVEDEIELESDFEELENI